MLKIIDSYFDFLAAHPDRIDAIILWTVTSAIITVVLVKTEARRIEGSKGSNGIWETPEQIIHLLSWIMPYPTVFVIYFQIESMVNYAWWMLLGGIGYGVGGRWLFEWALEFVRGRQMTTSSTEAAPDQAGPPQTDKDKTTLPQ